VESTSESDDTAIDSDRARAALTNSFADDNLREPSRCVAFSARRERREMMLMLKTNSAYRVIISLVAA
jgi:hypothetical protein